MANTVFLKKPDQRVFDFISQEEFNINDFLLDDPDNNILIYLNNKINPICFKRQYLETIRENNEFLECVIKNNQLMNKETQKGKPLFRIGYYLYYQFINALIDNESIKKLKNKKKKIFKLNIPTVQEIQMIKCINKEFLNLSTIGLNNQENKSLEKIDLYFDIVFNSSLRDYSYQWDAPINYYLRHGDIYFESTLFKTYWKRYYSYVPEYLSNMYKLNVKIITAQDEKKYFIMPKDINEAIQNVKEKIKQLDTCFLEAAPRIEKPTSFWRGMKGTYPISDTGNTTYIIPNFLSTTTSLAIAYGFSGHINNCCIYEFVTDAGIPYVDMKLTTEYKREKEILFPRNLKITYINKYLNTKINKEVIRVRLSVSNDQQFIIPTGCNDMYIGKIEPMKMVEVDEQSLKTKKNTTKKNTAKKNTAKKNDNTYEKENIECNKKNKDYNPKTKKCVKKCNPGKERNDNFRCITKKNKVAVKNKLNQELCNNKNKDYNPKTKKCVNKCKQGKIRNDNFRCVFPKPAAAAPPALVPDAAPLALVPAAAAPLALVPAAAPPAAAPAALVPAKGGLYNLIIKDKTQCSNMIKSMGKEIAKGGYGAIFQLSNGMLVKKSHGLKPQLLEGLSPEEDLNNCVTGKGCKNDIILEGLIMHALSTLNSEHFVRIEEFYHCENNYYIVMESLNGESYSNFIKKNAIDMRTRLTILFQITYALHLANSKLSFVHGDLIGQNIMITKIPRKIIEYKVTTFSGTTVYKIDNLGIRVVLIDFGFSRIKIPDPDKKNGPGIELYQTFRNPEYFPTKLDLFNGAADICKVYSNPTIVKDIDMTKGIINNGLISGRLIGILKQCKSVHWSHVAVPPFPQIFAGDILKSGLFNSIYL